MCAIAGVIDLPMKEETAKVLLKTMARRGPDGEGVYQKENCTLLHTRLAIIDPAGGAQPMILDWGGERYVLVYNGELYNTEELRRELVRQGHWFLSHSDSEVVLHAYAQWGKACTERFNGIFALAVWEQESQRLFLARDRIGVKPLFFMRHRGGLLFASEMKTILAYPEVPAMLDREGASQLLLLGPGRTPGSGIFHNMEEVEPGWRGYYEGGTLNLEQYWKLRDGENRDSFEVATEKVRTLVQDAIRRQMVSDVPIGTFLSGGLDSSLITAVCAGEFAKEGKRLDTFSVDYENNAHFFRSSKFQPNADPEYIRRMEQAVDTRHHWTVLTPEDLAGALEDATEARDLPGMADVDFSLLAFCREVRKDVKVVLSGECADEIFGGYPWYRDPEIRAVEGFPWAQNAVQRSRMLSAQLAEGCEPLEFIQQRYRDTCLESDILPDSAPLERRMKEMVNLNFRWFMQTLLDRKDRMSMYTGLEVRVPFCDYRIAEYLYTVPWAYKDHEGVEKGLLRKAMEGILPPEVLWRKKSPYPKTFDPRYLQLVSTRLRQLLEDREAPLFYLADREAVRELLNTEYPWPWYGQLMKKPQTIAWVLQVDHWLRHYHIGFTF